MTASEPASSLAAGCRCWSSPRWRVLLAAGVWMSRNPDRDALPSPLIGKPAPRFRAAACCTKPARTGHAGQELRGAPYLLNVWGSWCPECRVEHPVLTRFAETKRVRVIGYN